jgi:hypothetical protein
MNKPKWKDAPRWAKYMAMDGDGQWHWYRDKPDAILEDGEWGTLGRYKEAYVKKKDDDWKKTLEKRP